MNNARDLYDERFRKGYRASLSGYEVARWHALRHLITRILRRQDARVVLDYGSGSGLHVDLWNTVFPEADLYFCDISGVALDKLRKSYPRYAANCALVEHDAAGFRDNLFDVVVSVEVMEHVEHLEAYLRDVLRLLKPNGCFVWTTPCGNILSIEHAYAALMGKIETTEEGYRRWRFEDPSHLRRLKSREIEEMMKSLGFRDIGFRFRAHFFSFLSDRFLRGRMRKVGDNLMRLDYSLFRRLPNGASMIGYAVKPDLSSGLARCISQIRKERR